MTSRESNTRLKKLCRQELSQRRLIFASNRGPIEYYFTENRQLRARRGSGGVVTALSSISKYVELNWVTSAMGEGDRQMARETSGGRFRASIGGENLYLNFIMSFVIPFCGSSNIICGAHPILPI